MLGATCGGWERMFGFATRERYGRWGVGCSCSSGWAKEHLRKVPVPELGCATVGVFAAIRLKPWPEPRVRYSTTACLKPTTALCLPTCHSVMQVRSARAPE